MFGWLGWKKNRCEGEGEIYLLTWRTSESVIEELDISYWEYLGEG